MVLIFGGGFNTTDNFTSHFNDGKNSRKSSVNKAILI